MDLSNFIGKEQVPEQLSREIVRVFLALLHRRGASKPTAARRLSAIKSFVGWLRGEGILADDNWEKIATIKRPKMPETLPDIPSHEEMTILGSGAV